MSESLYTFPSSPEPVYPFGVEAMFKTLTTQFESGKEFRRKLWQFQKRELTLKYEALSDSEIATLYNFFVARNGSYEPFWFFYPFEETYTGEYVGRGDGTTVIFDLPSKSTKRTNLLTNGGFEVWSNGASSAPDGWTLAGTGASIARSGSSKSGSYSAAITYGSNATYIKQDLPDYATYQNQTLTTGAYVKTSVANQAFVAVDDSVGSTASSYHSGSGNWEWLTATRTIDSATTYTRASLHLGTAGTAYFDTTAWKIASSITEADFSPALAVYQAGVMKLVTVSAGLGGGGVDTITFSTAPASGAIITADFTGIQRLRARFKDDKMNRELFEYLLYNTGISMKECRY